MGEKYYYIFSLLYALFPPHIKFVQIEVGTIFVKDVTIFASFEENIYYQVRDISQL